MDAINLIASWAGWPIVVAVLIAAGGYAGWLQKNRIDQLKESNDALRHNVSSPDTYERSPDSYGIRILSPRLQEKVEHSFNVNGVLKEAPKGLEIWVFTCSRDVEAIRYWPQEPAKIRDNAWYSRVHNVDSGPQKILVFLVGENGRALIHYFKNAGAENKSWPGITELTDDIIQCTSVEVTVS